MIKKLDKLILKAFVGPFAVTLSVLVFIFLIQYMLGMLEELLGKDLGFGVYAELVFYFSLNMVPNAMPLAVLLSSLMTYGTLGEHRELSAIKSAGIPLTRIIAPVFVVTLLISASLALFNNFVLPKVNLQAFSLLYDIKTKKAALDIRPGIFYNGLPHYSVKVNAKEPDGKTLKGIMIYDHSEGRGNTKLTLADSGQMYTIFDGRYLVLELYRGENYSETGDNLLKPEEFVRNRFDHAKMVFSLASFDLQRTDIELFSRNAVMRDLGQLKSDVDSMQIGVEQTEFNALLNVQAYYFHLFRKPPYLVLNAEQTQQLRQRYQLAGTQAPREQVAMALNQARNIKAFTQSHAERIEALSKEQNVYTVEMFRKFTSPLACVVLFLIGASLGSIIKKGGLGVPILVSIVFFILFYVMTITGEKWGKESVLLIPFSMLYGNGVLLLVGLLALRSARKDANLFEADAWLMVFRRWGAFFQKKKIKPPLPVSEPQSVPHE